MSLELFALVGVRDEDMEFGIDAMIPGLDSRGIHSTKVGLVSSRRRSHGTERNCDDLQFCLNMEVDQNVDTLT